MSRCFSRGEAQHTLSKISTTFGTNTICHFRYNVQCVSLHMTFGICSFQSFSLFSAKNVEWEPLSLIQNGICVNATALHAPLWDGAVPGPSIFTTIRVMEKGRFRSLQPINRIS